MSDVEVVDAALRALMARGAAAWPGLAVSPAVFAAEIERRLGAPVDGAKIASLHHDVYLAIACSSAAGADAAIAECDRYVQRDVDVAAHRLHAKPDQVEDIRAEVRRLLFVADGERPAAITTFSGRGDLRAYVRVIAARALARRMQRDGRMQQLDDDMLDVLGPTLDPSVSFLRERYRDDVDAALRTALTRLEDRARAVLRYHLVEGWSVDQIGARYGVHRATAARWLAGARETVGALMRQELAARLAIAENEVDSIVALVTSRVDVSIERLLVQP